MTAFFTFVQLSQLATARLVLKHGAIVGARAAAVFTNEHKNNPGQPEGGNEALVTQGVKVAMLPWIDKGAFSDIEVKVEDSSTEEDPYNWVKVEVHATYHCNVPMGFIACGGRTKVMTPEIYQMPHQGAIYE
jgi:hypothetical protein